MAYEKVARWQGMTRSHGFTAEVFGDREQGLFKAHIEASSPALAPAIRPGGKTPMMTHEPGATITTYEDFETLKVLARKLITDRYGEIVQWRELEG